MSPILAEWLMIVRAASLAEVGSRDELALKNQQVFTISQAQLTELCNQEMLDFLNASVFEFAKKLAKAIEPFLFYAWFDEMSGTFRMSATKGRKPQDLPFGCRLEVCTEPNGVILDFLSGTTVEGIPWTELENVPINVTDDDYECEFVQRVYSRLLPRLARSSKR